MSGWMTRGLLGVFVLPWVLTATAAAGTEVPLPQGVSRLPEPSRVQLGRSTLDVQGFTSELEPEALIAFYEKALPRDGWRLAPLPWQAHHAEVTAHLKKAVAYQRESPEAEKMKETLAGFEETEQGLRRQIYAFRGEDHLIVNLWPTEDAGTMVFMNQWTGERPWMRASWSVKRRRLSGQWGRRAASSPGGGLASSPGGGLASSPGGGLSLTNVCCSGEEVPHLTGSLPFAVPRYPGAKAVAQNTPRGERSERVTTVLLMTHDPAKDVAAYYRRRMPINGWKLASEAEGVSSSSTAALVLAYEKPDRVCELTIAAPATAPEATGQAAQTMITVAVRRRTVWRGGR